MRTVTVIFSVLLFLSCQCTRQREVKEYSIEQFFKNIRISGGQFSQDESKLLISSDESGIYNVYEITIADGSEHQVTNSTVESFFAVDYVPGTGQIMYSADKGGNEINHLYLLSNDGTSRDLTPAEKEKQPSEDGARIRKPCITCQTKEIRGFLICTG